MKNLILSFFFILLGVAPFEHALDSQRPFQTIRVTADSPGELLLVSIQEEAFEGQPQRKLSGLSTPFEIALYDRAYKAVFYSKDGNSRLKVEVLRGHNHDNLVAVLTGIGKGVEVELSEDHGKLNPILLQ